MKMEVKQDEKTLKWGLYVNNALIGDSKVRYEADFAKQVLLRAQVDSFESKHFGGEFEN
jgi:hypothetical protein